MRFRAHAIQDHIKHLWEVTGRTGADFLLLLDTRVIEGRLPHWTGAAADYRGERLRIRTRGPLQEDPRRVGDFRVSRQAVGAATLVSKIRDLFEAGFFRRALRRVGWQRGRLHQPGDLGVGGVVPTREILSPGHDL